MSTPIKIKRWSRDQQVDCMFESTHGKWVRAKDHDVEVARLQAIIAERDEEIALDDRHIADLLKVVAAVPPCPLHGDTCIPHAVEWITAQIARAAT